MKQDYTFNFKNDGSFSYLTLSPRVGVTPVQYQVKMLENNRIPHLLPLSTAERDGMEELFYEITSCVTLEQILARRKMNKQEFLSLLNALLFACRELPEYQLPIGGLLLDEEQVFVRTGDFDVRFVYLPDNSDEEVIEPIRRFLLNLVMKSSIVVSADQFVPSLLELLNDPDLNIEKLQRFYRDQSQAEVNMTLDSKQVPEEIRPETKSASQAQAMTGLNSKQESKVHTDQHPGRRPPSNFNPDMFRHDAVAPKTPPKHERAMPAAPAKQTNTTVPQPPFAPTKKKSGTSIQRIIFIVLQGVLVVVVGLLLQSGALANEDGSFSVMNLIGVLIAAGGVDFLLSRRLLSAQKKEIDETPRNTPAQSAPQSQVREKSNLPPRMARPPVAQQPQQTSAAQNIPGNIQRAGHAQTQSSRNKAQTDYMQHSGRSYAAPVISESWQKQASNCDDAYEETVVMDENMPVEPCITYYENGLVRRVRFQNGKLLVGKQRSQVDLALPSPRVSHIHAQFYQQDGSYFVLDCNSKNGTYLNGSKERLTSNTPYELHNGDVIRIADTEVTFEC